MLTGNQITAARRLAGIRSQAALADEAGLARPTIEHAEQARDEIPSMTLKAMLSIVQALERAGIEFYLEPDAQSLVGAIAFRLRRR